MVGYNPVDPHNTERLKLQVNINRHYSEAKLCKEESERQLKLADEHLINAKRLEKEIQEAIIDG